MGEPLPARPDNLNYSRGIWTLELPERFGEKKSGKVRDSWVIGDRRVMLTSDRTSVFDTRVATVPGKGAILNLASAFFFDLTQDTMPNHAIAVPHPNVLIAQQTKPIPVEMVMRRFMAKSTSSTSVYDNYQRRGRRTIYGIDFPDGLRANQEFPMGTILTPTTKAEGSHDEELTVEQAKYIVDSQFEKGTWDRAAAGCLAVYDRVFEHCKAHGMLVADTKLEVGVAPDGTLMIIDEMFTPDSSRFWKAETYREDDEVIDPQGFDKEMLRNYLAKQGYRGDPDQEVPTVPTEVIDEMSQAYRYAYTTITGQEAPVINSDPSAAREAILLAA